MLSAARGPEGLSSKFNLAAARLMSDARLACRLAALALTAARATHEDLQSLSAARIRHSQAAQAVTRSIRPTVDFPIRNVKLGVKVSSNQNEATILKFYRQLLSLNSNADNLGDNQRSI